MRAASDPGATSRAGSADRPMFQGTIATRPSRAPRRSAGCTARDESIARCPTPGLAPAVRPAGVWPRAVAPAATGRRAAEGRGLGRADRSPKPAKESEGEPEAAPDAAVSLTDPDALDVDERARLRSFRLERPGGRRARASPDRGARGHPCRPLAPADRPRARRPAPDTARISPRWRTRPEPRREAKTSPPIAARSETISTRPRPEASASAARRLRRRSRIRPKARDTPSLPEGAPGAPSRIPRAPAARSRAHRRDRRRRAPA